VFALLFFRQVHGLTNVKRLKHGIIGYERWWETQERQQDSGGEEEEGSKEVVGGGEGGTKGLFQGTNFIFDQRPQPLAPPSAFGASKSSPQIER
jgi:hypothetical protein